MNVALWHFDQESKQLKDASLGTEVRPRYEAFLENIGWGVSFGTHRGFKGGLSQSTSGELLYFANRTTEIVYHQRRYFNAFSDFMQTVMEDTIQIVWIENLMVLDTVISSLQAALFNRGLASANSGNLINVNVTPSVSSPSAGSASYMILAIVPLRHCPGMNVIRVFDKNSLEKDRSDDGPVRFLLFFLVSLSDQIIGPLYDGMIVNSHSLAPLVRATCMTFHQTNKASKSNYKKPYEIFFYFSAELIEKTRCATRPD